jgi:hypothetical protein
VAYDDGCCEYGDGCCEYDAEAYGNEAYGVRYEEVYAESG